MKAFLEIKKEQKLRQNLSLNQKMKLSINVLSMPIEELNDFLEDEVGKNVGVELKFYSSQKNFYRDEDFSQVEEISQEKNFFEELEEQINFMKLNKKQKENCIFIINNLNEKGYLNLSKKELVKLLKVSENELEETMKIIHSLEPCGVGASSLEECLKIQLKQKNIFDEKLYRLIDKYLMLVAEKKYDLIKQKLMINETQLQAYIKEIRKLNPILTRGYNIGKIRRIVPEIIVKKIENKYSCEVNEKVIPKISIKNEDELERDFYSKIVNLITAIKRRYETLLNISNLILERQRIFFETKGEKLNTLKIVDIANELDLSPSTISRAIKDKFLLTDFGTIAFKKIICINSEALLEKNLIEKYIEKEDREKPYSDQDLTEFLNKEGFKIARRTVSKYRKELGYKSSSKRKI